MRDYAKKTENQSHTLDSSPKASKQAPIDVILQRYKERNIQRYAEDEELIQGKFDTTQCEKIVEDELLQGKFEASSTIKQESIQREEKPNNTGLPDNLKTGIENLSGYSMDDVRVYYSSNKPAQFQALAYTQGTDIHVTSGQEKHLPHEAWHVVQQKQGRVQPTRQLGSMNVNDNEGLEKEADVMGEEAMKDIHKKMYQSNAPFIKSLYPDGNQIQLFPQKDNNKTGDINAYEDSDFTYIKLEKQGTDGVYHILQTGDIVKWVEYDSNGKYQIKVSDTEWIDFNLQFLDFITLYKEVSKAISQESIDANTKRALQMHLLQKFMSNALYTADEIAKLQYQTSPFSYQEKGSYIRSGATAYVHALKDFLLEGNADIPDNDKFHLTQSEDFNLIMGQFAFRFVPTVTGEKGAENVTIGEEYSPKIEQIATYLLEKGSLKDFDKAYGVSFADVTGIPGINPGLITKIQNEVFEKVKTTYIEKFIEKYKVIETDEETVRNQLKEYFLNQKKDIPKVLQYYNAKKKKEHDEAEKTRIDTEVEKLKQGLQDYTKETSADVDALAEKYKNWILSFKDWLPKAEDNTVENSIYTGVNDDKADLISKVNTFKATNQFVESKEKFKTLVKTQVFKNFLEHKLRNPDSKEYKKADQEKLLTTLGIANIDTIKKALNENILIGESKSVSGQSGFLIHSETEKHKKLAETALNKAGYVPTPSMASRKMLAMDKSLKDIVKKIAEHQKGQLSGIHQQYITNLLTLLEKDTFLATTSDSSPSILGATKKTYTAFKKLETNDNDYVKLEVGTVIKLVDKTEILGESSLLPPIILNELNINLQNAISNLGDMENIAAFMRNIQNIHEVIIFALEQKPGTTSTTTLSEEVTGLLPTGVQSPHYTEYGLKAFAQAFNAAFAQHSSEGGEITIDAYSNIYFEVLDKLGHAELSSGKKWDVQKPMEGNSTNKPDVIVIDIHPNDASKPEMHKQEIVSIVNAAFVKDAGEKSKITVIIDITLNHIGDDEVKEIKKGLNKYIENGRLNLVFIQSLTKFAQLGMDKHSGGLMFHYNNGNETWGKFNDSIEKQIPKSTVDRSTQSYFNLLFTAAPKEQKAYIVKVRKNTKYVYDKLKTNFEKCIGPNAIELSLSDDPGTCYVAFNYGELSARLYGGDKSRDIKTEKLGIAIIEKIYDMINKLELPLSMRQSFGFPISNFGEAWIGTRFTIGIEPTKLLDQYIDVITYVNLKLVQRVNELKKGKKHVKEKGLALQNICNNITTLEQLTTELNSEYEIYKQIVLKKIIINKLLWLPDTKLDELFSHLFPEDTTTQEVSAKRKAIKNKLSKMTVEGITKIPIINGNLPESICTQELPYLYKEKLKDDLKRKLRKVFWDILSKEDSGEKEKLEKYIDDEIDKIGIAILEKEYRELTIEKYLSKEKTK